MSPFAIDDATDSARAHNTAGFQFRYQAAPHTHSPIRLAPQRVGCPNRKVARFDSSSTSMRWRCKSRDTNDFNGSFSVRRGGQPSLTQVKAVSDLKPIRPSEPSLQTSLSIDQH